MLKSRFIFIFLMITTFCVISSAPLFAEEEPEQEPVYSYLLNIFENKYMEISERVNQGNLPAAALAQADEIRMDLKKFLINRNAELEILRLDVLEGSKEKSTAALERMNNLLAETEQSKMQYIQKLVELAPGSGPENYAMMPSQGAQSTDSLLSSGKKSTTSRKKARRKKYEKETIWETKDINKRMQVSPEDLSMGKIK